jgi:hypothetical protein
MRSDVEHLINVFITGEELMANKGKGSNSEGKRNPPKTGRVTHGRRGGRGKGGSKAGGGRK